jgi:hypothetical protein
VGPPLVPRRSPRSPRPRVHHHHRTLRAPRRHGAQEGRPRDVGPSSVQVHSNSRQLQRFAPTS